MTRQYNTLKPLPLGAFIESDAPQTWDRFYLIKKTLNPHLNEVKYFHLAKYIHEVLQINTREAQNYVTIKWHKEGLLLICHKQELSKLIEANKGTFKQGTKELVVTSHPTLLTLAVE